MIEIYVRGEKLTLLMNPQVKLLIRSYFNTQVTGKIHIRSHGRIGFIIHREKFSCSNATSNIFRCDYNRTYDCRCATKICYLPAGIFENVDDAVGQFRRSLMHNVHNHSSYNPFTPTTDHNNFSVIDGVLDICEWQPTVRSNVLSGPLYRPFQSRRYNTYPIVRFVAVHAVLRQLTHMRPSMLIDDRRANGPGGSSEIYFMRHIRKNRNENVYECDSRRTLQHCPVIVYARTVRNQTHADFRYDMLLLD